MSQDDDFFRFRRFRLELDGVVQGAFDRLAPPAADDDGRVRGERRARLFDGIANTRELHQWFGGVLRGAPDPRRGAVVALDDRGEELVRLEFSGAWPARLRVATLTPDTLFEVAELELAVETWRAVPGETPPAARPPAGGPHEGG